MNLRELLSNLDVDFSNAEPETEIGGIAYDSRNVRPGDVFVAIKGYESDGHAYIASAMEKGAVAVICEDAPEARVPYVRVENGRSALALTAAAFYGRPALRMKIIGVTGTNGKTTTATLIKHMLEKVCGAKVGLVGTNMNMIGDRELPTERTTPESLELHGLFRDMADEGCEYVVMEVSSHSLYLHRVEGIHFDIGVFTNLTQDHLDFHGTMQEYAAVKALLFSQCDKCAINYDDDYAKYMMDAAQKAGCEVLTYSELTNDAELTAKDIKLRSDCVKFCALTTGMLERVTLGIPGRFSVYNALSVLSCGLLLGLPFERCTASLSDAKGVKGRMEVVPADGDYQIIIDYAHTPDALENVLRSLKEVATGRVVALFGCGGDRDRTKRPVMGRIAADIADFVIVTSDNPRTENPEAIIAGIREGMMGTKTPSMVIPDRREAIAWAIDNHKPGDIIVLCGKGHETYQIVGKTKHHMDEREIVAQLKQRGVESVPPVGGSFR